MERWRWVLMQVGRQLWLRATLIGIFGVVAAIVAAFAERYIPWELPGIIGADAVDSVLTIIASSMLAVTTFSLSVVTSAYGAAASNVTPRATRLVMEDRVTHNVLSTFVGSFLFAIVGIVVLRTGAYGERGRFILFVVTIAVIALIVVSLLRWINHLIRLGRSGETTDRVEEAARQAIQARIDQPYMGGTALSDRAPQAHASATPVRAVEVGYVQNIDMPALSQFCEENGVDIRLAVLPGHFVYLDTPVAWIEGAIEDEETEAQAADTVRDAFVVGGERSFEQDPRFGLVVMSEIASRALPPSANDPGTALDIIGRNTRLMTLWARSTRRPDDEDVRFPRVHVPPLDMDDLFDDAFMLIGRDGAAMIELQLRLQKSLHALSRIGDDAFRAAALKQAALAYRRAEAALSLDADRERLREFVDTTRS